MKKITSLILTAVLLAAMLMAFAVPAMAEPEIIYSIDASLSEECIIDSEAKIETGGVIGGMGTVVITKNGFLSGQGVFLESVDLRFRIEDGGGLYIHFNSAGHATSFCNILSESNIDYFRRGNTVQAGACKHTDVQQVCMQCGKPVLSSTGSILSEGSLTIIVGIACLAVGALGMYLIMKKKKPAVAGGTESKDE